MSRSSMKGAFWAIIRSMSYVLRFPIFLAFSIVPTNSHLWVFTAGEGDTFTGNSKYLFLHLHGQEVDFAVKPVWLSTDPSVVKTLRWHGYSAYHRRSLRGRLVLARAGVAFLTHGNPLWPFTANTTVVQTWHGVGIKSMGRNEPEESSLLRSIYRKYIFENWDYFVVTGEGKPASKYRSAFDLNKDQILTTGLPRNDALFREFEDSSLIGNEAAIEFFDHLSSTGPLICYLPTWRRAIGKEAGSPLEASHIDIDAIDELLNQSNANLVIKPHPMSSADFESRGAKNVHVLDQRIDMYAVLKHVDVLVTDYSSIYIDFVLLDRPILFYPYDLNEYQETRGFAFDYEENTPGPIATIPESFQQELATILETDDRYRSERNHFTDDFHAYRDAHSCDRLIEKIKDDIHPQNLNSG